MFVILLSPVFQGAMELYVFSLVSFLLAAFVFSTLEFFPRLKCNDQPPWWQNQSVRLDVFYVVLNPVFKAAFRFVPLALMMALLLPIVPIEYMYNYLANGCGPLGSLSPIAQCAVFLVASDFLLYWNHRLFHNKIIWPFHAIHHGAANVDWTTAYRFHPLNLALGPWFVTTLMIFLGVSPRNIIAIAPFEAIMAFFVHSNLNLSLGPVRYLIATPVFHRWHHVKDGRGSACNYGAIFSLWDVVFATFYLPSKRLPGNYGVENAYVPESFVSQLSYPFLTLWRLMTVWAKSSAPTTVRMSSPEPTNRD